MKMPKYQKKRVAHLDYPKSFKFTLTIVRVIASWLSAEPETISGRKQASYLRPRSEFENRFDPNIGNPTALGADSP
jgi:hypothetical protein